MSHSYRIIISGYYGFGNLGDELILSVIIRELKKRGFQITVLSKAPELTKSQYGVQAVHRMNLPDIFDAFAHADIFISGGGGLFQDATGLGSVLYYGGLIQLARFFELTVIFFAQGVGPLHGDFARFFTQKALERSALITVRDKESADLIQTLTGHLPEITADPVWLYEMPTQKPLHPTFSSLTGIWHIGISLRPWRTLTFRQIQAFAYFLKNLIRLAGKTVHIHLFAFQETQDEEPLKLLEKSLRSEQIENLTITWTPQETLMKTLSSCDLFFGMRFHSLVLALLAKIPVYGLPYDPKVQHLLETLRLKGTDVSQLDMLDEEMVYDHFLRYRYPDLEELQNRAQLNFQRLDELMKLEEMVIPLSSF